ncbi:glycoside hydrolase family 55 protein [Erwinia phyllosphaerae]|uniref:glycoside hydrolase family 55 protein n=1 Tax=Erwinia phyllosphaerae TaxID=2853256 RepID=UPI001FEFFB62|nr:glycoside hydrolase family 55 protein [Erwinia phyllosphaerae]MBV4365930.1 glycoside hydrolase family 55 protein [Erwinia phyllosphaerae]
MSLLRVDQISPTDDSVVLNVSDIRIKDSLVPANQVTISSPDSRNLQDWISEHRSVKSYGAKGNGVDDDTSAFNLAITAAMSEGFALKIPSGTYYLSSALSISIPSGKNLAILGDAPATTILKWIGTSAGINITTAGVQEWQANSVHISGLMLQTNQYNTGTGISVDQEQQTGIPAGDVTLANLVLCGTVTNSTQWGTDILLKRTGGSTIRDITIFGKSEGFEGYGVLYQGTSDDVSAQHTIDNVRVFFKETALKANQYIQGLFFNAFNVFNCKYGISWDASSLTDGQTEAHITNSQFTATYPIAFKRIGFVTASNNMFIGFLNDTTTTGVMADFDTCYDVVFSSNNIYGGNSSRYIGVAIQGTSGASQQGAYYPSLITNNTFDSLLTGVSVASTASGVRIRNNVFTASVTTNVDDGASDTVKDNDLWITEVTKTFSIAAGYQTLTVSVPDGLFKTRPRIAEVIFLGDYLLYASYNRDNSTSRSLEFIIRKTDATNVPTGPYALAIKASS